MEGQPEKRQVLDGPGQALAGKDQTANAEPDTANNILHADAPISKPVTATPEPLEESTLKENTPLISNEAVSGLKTSSQIQPSAAQTSSKGGGKRREPSSEAVRRGLSFGPIKKPGQTESPTRAILKATSKSPPPRFNQRTSSAGGEGQDSGDDGMLEKEKYAENADEEGVVESSEDDTGEWSSEDENSPSGQLRGRKREEPERAKSAMATKGDSPTVTVTAPEGEKPVSTSKRFIAPVHPNTNFDHLIASKTPSPSASANTTDSEEMDDIRSAQRLDIEISNVDTTIPRHAIQTITRGEFEKTQEEAREGSRRLRKYVVATDLSEEAKYALEWTIGTILRDGDILYAIYAVNEETGTGKAVDGLPVGEGGNPAQDTTATVERAAASSKKGTFRSSLVTTLRSSSRGSRSPSTARSPGFQAQERTQATDLLRRICLDFIRRTKLQVRIVIEVIHCKSPRSMIMDAVSGHVRIA